MSRHLPMPPALLPAAFLTLLSVGAHAQCGLDWQPGAGTPGPAGAVFASARLPDGDLLVGGGFAVAGTALANNLARFDGNAWSGIGNGVDGTVRCMTRLPNGDIVIGGSFQTADGVPAGRVARFDGSTFHPYGSGLQTGGVESLLVLPNGDLLVSGPNLSSGGQSMNGIARWDGNNWSPLLGNVVSGFAGAMARLSNGDLLFAGIAVQQGTGFLTALVRYDGTNLSTVPGLDSDSNVYAILPLGLGQFVISGDLRLGGAPAAVALFDGTTIQDLGASPGLYYSLALDSQNNLIAGGRVTPPATDGLVARYDGQQWSTLPGAAPRVVTDLLPGANGELIACGQNSPDNLFRNSSVRRFDGVGWSDLSPAAPLVLALAAMPNGDVIAGGDFTSIGGVAANHVARRQGETWQPIGNGLDGVVTALAVNGSGQIVAGGIFAGGPGSAGNVALWSGGVWSIVGAGLPAAPLRIAIDEQGRILATSLGYKRLFDGIAWQDLPALNGNPNTILADGNGEFLLAGVFTQVAGMPVTGIVRYAAGAYSVEPTGLFLARDMVRMRDGTVVAAGAGQGTTLTRFANGSWTPIPILAPSIEAICELGNGELAGITAALPRRLLLLRSTAELLGELQMPVFATNGAELLGTHAGDVFVTNQGGVLSVDGVVTAGIAHGKAQCPATATPIGSGCFGTTGAVTMAATDLPWLGKTFRSQLTGMALPTIGLHLAGINQLSVALPFGAPGCTLQVEPVLVDAFVPGAATSTVAFTVPSAPALVGQQLLTQVVAFELDAVGAISRTTASNALQLTVGAF